MSSVRVFLGYVLVGFKIVLGVVAKGALKRSTAFVTCTQFLSTFDVLFHFDPGHPPRSGKWTEWFGSQGRSHEGPGRFGIWGSVG